MSVPITTKNIKDDPPDILAKVILTTDTINNATNRLATVPLILIVGRKDLSKIFYMNPTNPRAIKTLNGIAKPPAMTSIVLGHALQTLKRHKPALRNC